jgi:hypothetical protein
MGLLDLIFGSKDASAADATDEALAQEIIDRVVDATDKRLRNVSGYQKRLRDPALATLAHARAFLRDLGPAREISARAWAEDRSIRPLFVRQGDVPAAFSADRDVRRVFAESAAAECICVAGFELQERQVFAPALHGDVVQQEVARTAVSFSKPRFLAPAADEPTMRRELGKRVVDYLALRALARITAEQEEMDALAQERALLKARLRLAERGHRGLSGLTGTEDAAGASPPEAIERELQENERALAGHAATNLMDRFLAIVSDVLATPQDHISVVPRHFALDAMNFVAAEGDASASRLEIAELRLAERAPYAVLLARFPRNELLPAPDLIAAAERLL